MRWFARAFSAGLLVWVIVALLEWVPPLEFWGSFGIWSVLLAITARILTRKARSETKRGRLLDALRRHPTEEFTSYELTGLAYMKPGTIYPILYRLVNEGLVSARWVEAPDARRQRMYRIASTGAAEDLSHRAVPVRK